MGRNCGWCSIWIHFDYRPTAKPNLSSLEMAKNAATLPERLRLLLANDPAKDKAAAFLWPFLAALWNFAVGSHRRSLGRCAFNRRRHACGIQLGDGSL